MTRFRTFTHRPWAAAASLLAGASLAFATGASAQIQSGTLISLDDGDVQGQVENGARNFLGIPYAAPPVGSLRWRPPAEPAPWVGTLDASSYSNSCPQGAGLIGTPSTDEDCLYLNVWTPEEAPEEPLPVMVWIHGGGNTTGSTADFVPFPPYEANRLYDGSLLVSEQNVVLVTLNYRLGTLGFFAHPDLAAEDGSYPYAGNQGLLDQRAALEWVRDNILAFGGDPEKVTIFGESAGSWNVCAHVVSPMSEGLFHRAISQSGGCSFGTRSMDDAQSNAQAVSAALACDGEEDELACLRATPVQELLDNVINPGISVDGGFLPEDPKDLFDSGEFSRVPYILGANTDEGTVFFIDSVPLETDGEYQAELIARFGSFAPEVEATYPSSSFATPQDAIIRVFGDAGLVCPTYDVASRVADAKRTKTRKRAKVFAYIFARVVPVPFVTLLDLGAFHGVELAFIFGSIEPPSSTDNTLGIAMRNYWASFADRGKPKAKKQRGWGKFKTKNFKIQRLGNDIIKTKGFRQEECLFWSGILGDVPLP